MLISSLTYPLCVDDCDQLGSQESSILKGTEINYKAVVSLYFFFFFWKMMFFFAIPREVMVKKKKNESSLGFQYACFSKGDYCNLYSNLFTLLGSNVFFFS